jgi:Tol biopolymer transport system component
MLAEVQLRHNINRPKRPKEFMKIRNTNWRSGALLLLVVCGALSAAAQPLQPVSALASALVAPAGGGGDSWSPIISSDGRYVLFSSTANNLALNSSNGPIPSLFSPRLNVYLRDRTAATTTLVSVNLAGTGGGNDDSTALEISTNGQYALFESSASDLVPGDTNKISDVFVRDLVNGTTLLVTTGTNGGAANGISRGSVMTPDGRYVAFTSAASNLVPGDTNSIPDVFVRDLQAGITTLASPGARSTNLSSVLSGSESPDLTPDGRYVAFLSTATNLVPGVQSSGEVYVRDLVAGTTRLVSVNAHTAVQSAMGTTNAISYNQVISADGRFVTYEASPGSPTATAGVILRHSLETGLTDIVYTNADVPLMPLETIRSLDMTPDGRFIAFVARVKIVPGLTNLCVYLWDAQSGTATLASGDLTNGVSANLSDSPAIDPSGRFVAFLSDGPSLTTNSVVGDSHLYVRDTQAGTTLLVDAGTNGAGSGVSMVTSPRWSADARFLVFESPDGNLVTNDSNHDYDVFVRDVTTNTLELISAHAPALPSLTPNGLSGISSLSISLNGRYVAFYSDANNLVANDTNGCRDVFLCDLLLGTNILVSVDPDGFGANGVSVNPAISADGRYVAFASSATNLVAGDNNRAQDVYVRDLLVGATKLVSIGTNGVAPGNAASDLTMMSADGRSVLFRSKAQNLATGVFASGIENLFWRDLQAGVTYALTTAGVLSAAMTPDGRFVTYGGLNTSLYVWDSLLVTRIYTNTMVGIANTAISPDGKRLAFSASNHLYAADVAARTNWVFASLPLARNPGLRFSGDGRFLAYLTSGAQLPSDTNGVNDVYLYDFETGTNLLVSQSYSASGAGNGPSDSPAISADGRFVAYRSSASNLVPGDTNGVPDVFLYDRLNSSTTLLSVNQFGDAPGNNRSMTPVFTGDGQTLMFRSWASDLVAQDFNHWGDVFALKLSSSNVTPAFLGQIIFVGPSSQNPTITWPVVPGKAYRVEFKNNLEDFNWQVLNGSVTLMGGKGSVTDLAPGPGHRFYRIVSF